MAWYHHSLQDKFHQVSTNTRAESDRENFQPVQSWRLLPRFDWQLPQLAASLVPASTPQKSSRDQNGSPSEIIHKEMRQYAHLWAMRLKRVGCLGHWKLIWSKGKLKCVEPSVLSISHVPNQVHRLADHLWHPVICFSSWKTPHIGLYLSGNKVLLSWGSAAS